MTFDYSNDISTSGPVAPQNLHLSDSFTQFTELSSKGYCRIVKAQRYGMWNVLKGLKLENAGDEQYHAMISKEFSLMAELNHPNIVRTYGFEQVAELGTVIVMEFVDGRTLSDFIKENPSASQRRQVLCELLDAMSYFHKKQIVHQDLKPSNILITNDGNHVKIIDFGLSDSREYAILKEPAYTQAYAAPEQLSGGEIDNRTDLYAFGLILRQLFPKRYGGIVQKCLQPQREKRYASAESVASAISKNDKVQHILHIIVLASLGLMVLLFVIFYIVNHQINKNHNSPNTIKQTDTEEKMTVVNGHPIAQKQLEGSNIISTKAGDDYVMQQVNIFSKKLDSIYAPYEQAYQAGKIAYSDISTHMQGTCLANAICFSLQMEYELFSTAAERNLFEKEICKLLQKKNIRYSEDYKLPHTVEMKNKVTSDEYDRIQAEAKYWEKEYEAAGERQREALAKYR